MLGKLMRHELIATSRLLIPTYFVLLFLSIINRLLINMNFDNKIFEVVRGLVIFAYGTSVFVVIVVTFFYMIIRFYKNLLTDEGYLMFTLPVKKHELVNSKLLITILWTIISILSIIISLFIVFATNGTFLDTINIIKEAILNLTREFGVSWVLVSFEVVIISFLTLAASILMIYLSIAIGQLFSKHRIVGSFVAYIGIYAIIQTLLGIAIIIFSNMGDALFANHKLVIPISMSASAIACGIFYYGLNYLLTKRLNLE
jgi:hypothetical protein